jgi:hypothetical protein
MVVHPDLRSCVESIGFLRSYCEVEWFPGHLQGGRATYGLSTESHYNVCCRSRSLAESLALSMGSQMTDIYYNDRCTIESTWRMTCQCSDFGPLARFEFECGFAGPLRLKQSFVSAHHQNVLQIQKALFHVTGAVL